MRSSPAVAANAQVESSHVPFVVSVPRMVADCPELMVTVVSVLLVENGRRARRRRCRECAKARLAALLIQESIKFAVPAADTVGTSVRKGGRGEVPEPLSGAGASPPRPCLVKPR